MLRGRRDQQRAAAWYVHALKDVGRLEVGGELFRLGPRYGGGYDSRRGGVRSTRTWAGKAKTNRCCPEFPLVDDNDDNDRYADDNLRDYPNGSETESGVFPGLDEDNDNIPDDDKNANGIPDFEEPFLLYYSNPQEFVYGIDLNNNGVIDERENDNKPDYPYDRDRRGLHGFVALPDWRGLSAGVGYYRQDEIAGPGRPCRAMGGCPMALTCRAGDKSSSTTTASGSRIRCQIRSMSSAPARTTTRISRPRPMPC